MLSTGISSYTECGNSGTNVCTPHLGTRIYLYEALMLFLYECTLHSVFLSCNCASGLVTGCSENSSFAAIVDN